MYSTITFAILFPGLFTSGFSTIVTLLIVFPLGGVILSFISSTVGVLPCGVCTVSFVGTWSFIFSGITEYFAIIVVPFSNFPTILSFQVFALSSVSHLEKFIVYPAAPTFAGSAATVFPVGFVTSIETSLVGLTQNVFSKAVASVALSVVLTITFTKLSGTFGLSSPSFCSTTSLVNTGLISVSSVNL